MSQKILFISARADRSGGPLYMRSLISALPDFEIHVAAPSDGIFEDFSNRFPECFVVLPERSFNIGSFWNLHRHCRLNSIELIHSHGRGAGVYGRLLSIALGIKIIHTLHGIHLPTGIIGNFLLTYEQVTARFTDVIVCVGDSEFALARKLQIGTQSSRTLIRTGVVARTSLQPRQFDFPLTIAHYTRFDEQKNFRDFLRIISESVKRGLLDKCIVIGDGINRDHYLSIASSMGLEEYIKYKNSVDSPMDTFSSCDLLLVTSKWEGLPLIILEAMNAGLPVIASRVVGNVDLIQHMETGILYDSNNWMDCVSILKQLSLSDLEKFSDAAFKFVNDRYNFDSMAREHREVYRDLLA